MCQAQAARGGQQRAEAAASSGGSKGVAGSSLFDFAAAYPQSPGERLRRASMSAAAWEQAQRQAGEEADAEAAEQRQQGAGQPPAGHAQQQQEGVQGQAPPRRKSMSDALRHKPRPQQPRRPSSSSGRGFDTSLALDFGSSPRAGNAGAGARLGPAAPHSSDFDDASYYGGDGTSTYGGSYHGAPVRCCPSAAHALAGSGCSCSAQVRCAAASRWPCAG